MPDKIIGIDLGTTNSAVALIREGVPTLIRVDDERILPSVVGISPQGEVLVGTTARNQWVVAPENTIRSIKRQMGSTETVTMAGQSYTPQEISAFILRRLREAAEAELGYAVERAVITVPAYFNEVQRQATIEAGGIAGLTVERIINEPTAAALAYGLGKEEARLVLVYDLGGGTFDVSIIELNSGVVDVRATAGNNQLGGDDFDLRLAEMLAEEFRGEHGIALEEDHQAWARLLRAAEEAKIELSSAPYALVSLEFIAQGTGGVPLHLHREVARSEFEEEIADLVEGTIGLIDQALTDAGLEAKAIDRVLLVGGSTRIPLVIEQVTARMDKEPHIEIDPDAAVALGAAVQGGIIAGEEIDAILVDVTPMSLGIETAWVGLTGHVHADHFTPLVRRNTTIPVQKSELFTTLAPGQDKIQIKVYQGEEALASRNTLLGEFMVDKLKPNRPDGLTEVTVNFRLDVNGILDVTVVERKSGKQVSEQLKANRQRLSPDEIEKSQAKVAQAHAAAAPKLDVGTIALLDRAQAALDRDDLDDDLGADITEIIAAIHEAAAAGDAAVVEELGDELVDLLMEAEE